MDVFSIVPQVLEKRFESPCPKQHLIVRNPLRYVYIFIYTDKEYKSLNW